MLAGIVSAIGSADFYQVLYAHLRQEYSICQMVVQRYEGAEGPIQPLAALSEDAPTIDTRLGEYVRLRSADPFREDLLPQRARGVVVRAVRECEMETSEYRQRLFSAVNLGGKLSLIARGPESTFSVSMYRHLDERHFGEADIGRLQAVSSVVAAAVERHFDLRREPAWNLEELTQLFRELRASKPLSEREAAVCAHVLLGYSNLAISLNLGLSIHSISTYRRRSYTKLGVTAQSELLSALMQHSPAFGKRPAPWQAHHPPAARLLN